MRIKCPKIISFLFCGLILLAVSLAIVVQTRTSQAAPASAIYFDPASRTVNLNEMFTLDAKINPGSNQITAVEVHVTYDHTKFQLQSVTKGSAFPLELQPAVINNSNGTASIVLGINYGNPPSYVTTATTVAAFSFKATGAVAASPISFTTATQAAAAGEGSTNVIITRTPASVTVSSKKYGLADFTNLITDWLKTVPGSQADVNSDGIVNSRDLGIMMSNWGG